MLVYHGTQNQFTQFDYDKIGLHGTSEGIGFYFTDNQSIAESYAEDGYILAVEFNNKKSLSYDTLTITKAQFKRFITELHKYTGCLDNYADTYYVGINRAAQEATRTEFEGCTNDVDLICSICNSSGSKEQTLKALHKVLGFDSIEVNADWGGQKIYIALVTDIIEIKTIKQVTSKMSA